MEVWSGSIGLQDTGMCGYWSWTRKSDVMDYRIAREHGEIIFYALETDALLIRLIGDME